MVGTHYGTGVSKKGEILEKMSEQWTLTDLHPVVIELVLFIVPYEVART